MILSCAYTKSFACSSYELDACKFRVCSAGITGLSNIGKLKASKPLHLTAQPMRTVQNNGLNTLR